MSKCFKQIIREDRVVINRIANVSKNKGTSENKLVRMTFDAPSSLRRSSKIKVASEDKDIEDVFRVLMRAYIDNRVSFKKTK